MDFALIQSASLAAVNESIPGDIDVQWKNAWQSGDYPAETTVRISMVSDRIVGEPYLEFSVDALTGDIIEYEAQNHSIVLQYDVATKEQSLEKSAAAVASTIRGQLNLTSIRELHAAANIAISSIGNFFDTSGFIEGTNRIESRGSFEITFNATSYISSSLQPSIQIVSGSGNIATPIDVVHIDFDAAK